MCGCGGSVQTPRVTREASGSSKTGMVDVVHDPGGYVWNPPERTPPPTPEQVPAKA